MDPKMDTGMIMDDTATGPVYNINRRVSPTEFIWIFDNILIGQVKTYASLLFTFAISFLRA